MSAALPAVAADPLTPIVYNDRRTTIETRRRLAELRAVASAAVGTVAHDAIVALLIAWGELESEVRAGAGAHFLVVDEGPGLSGSSFAAVAEWLLALGVPEELIVFFPSWPTDGGGLRSERARRLWPRIRKYTVSFEECWLESGRLGEGLPEGRLRDLSGGGWRSVLYRTAADYPAVHPQHERRKYLVEWAPSVGRADGGEPLLLKFTGLGGYGERRRVIAERLAAAGYSPPVRGARHGFSLSMFCAGEPLHPGVSDDVLLETMARYLAFRRREFPADRDVPIDELLGMIRHNTVVRLGSAALGELEWLDSWRERVEARGVVAIDGRMLPHEWLRTPGGYLKVDGVDHHDDHFFPGCQDIAWDIAGAVVEFGFGGAAERALLERYRALSGDAGVEEVLPFYRVAYLAFRLGYALLAASSLGECGDGRRFAAAARRYRVLLRRASRLSR